MGIAATLPELSEWTYNSDLNLVENEASDN